MKGYRSFGDWVFWGVLMNWKPLRKVAERIFPEWKHWLKVIPLFLLLSGCATTYTPPDPCLNKDGSYKESLILEHISNPKQASLLLELANLEFLKQTDAYSRKDALMFIDKVREAINKGTTWEELFEYVVTRSAKFNEAIGAEVVLISGYYGVLAKDVPITECDRAMLMSHLDRQESTVALASGGISGD